MNILFDQTEAQTSFFNGAAEYAQTLFLRMIARKSDYPQTKLFCLYDSTRPFKYHLLKPELISKKYDIDYLDYANKNIRQIVKDNHIDLLFITCAQAFCDLPVGDLNNLGCKVVLVIHDMYLDELKNSRIEILYYIRHRKEYVSNFMKRVKYRILSKAIKSRGTQVKSLIENNDTTIIAVSNYTKQSIEYFYPDYSKKIQVFYSPIKTCTVPNDFVENEDLRRVIEGKQQYFLLMSADRPTKNGEKMLQAFKHYVENDDPEALILTTGYGKSLFPQHIALSFLSSSDVEHAYKNCTALLYPSLFEGFGYPPIEAMRFDKPVLSSNVCSMPEILGDSPIYFSPIYESSMYGALRKFRNSSYKDLQAKAKTRFKIISDKQEEDLKRLSGMLLDGSFIISDSAF